MKKQILFVTAALSGAMMVTGCGSSNEPRNSNPPPQAHAQDHSHRRHHPSPNGSPDEPADGPVVSAERVDQQGEQTPSGSDQSDDQSGLPAYQMKDFTADMKNLIGAENALKAVGMKVAVVFKSNKPVSVNWDYDFMDAYKGDVIDTAPDALANFSRVGHQFLQKYNREFTIDGKTTVAQRLDRETIPVLVAKLTLVENTLEKLLLKRAERNKGSKK